MKKLKGFIFVIIGLAAVITLISLLMPSTVVTIRSVTINAEPENVMAQISNLNNWKNWHPFFKNNADVKEVNDDLEWTEKGELNKLHISEKNANGIRILIERKKNKSVINDITLSVVDNQTQVEWKGVTYVKWYPWEKFSGIFLNSIVGPGYESALNGLKSYEENLGTIK
ncbi:MAG: SRPBCC family protein [Ferruginibacter sp.]